MPVILVASPRFAEHQTPPGHPESRARAGVMDKVAGAWRDQGGEVVAPRAATTEQLAEEVPDDIILVSESGIKSAEDAQRVADCGADALLVGETLMRHERRLEMARALRVERLILE